MGGGRLQEMVTHGGLPVAQKLTSFYFTYSQSSISTNFAVQSHVTERN